MSTLRILHVTPYAGEAWAYGGIPRIVSTLAHEQARRGHAVTILATDAGTETRRIHRSGRPSGRPSFAGLTAGGSCDLHLFRNPSNRLAYAWQAFWPIGMSRFLAEHAGDFDIAHLHACRNFPGVIAARHLNRARVPYVLVPNGTAPIIERRFLAKRVFDFAFGDDVMASAAAIVAVTDAERHQLLSLGIPSSKIRLASNPVDVDEFVTPPARGQFRSRFGLGDAPVVLFLGKLTPRKRVDVLVRAFARLERPDAKLVIAGNDMGSGRELRVLVRSLDTAGLKPRGSYTRPKPRGSYGQRVFFTGLLTGADRIAALADADVVVYPSADEIFGLVPLESILAGTPVVVADDSGCGEVIGATGGGIVVPLGDVDALGGAIARILDDRGAWRPRVHEAAGRVRDRFSPAVVADLFDGIYQDALPKRLETIAAPEGVSVVVPVRNGATWIAATLEAIWREQDARSFEVIVVDDGSSDGSVEAVRRVADERPVRIITGEGRGAAAALNLGFRAARFPIVCQVDQDVTIGPGWLSKLTAALADPRVAAAQGRYVVDPEASLSARIMALDLEQRYAAIAGTETSHVCTGNAAYRADAVHSVGLFDETLGYGYDNDLSYRLRAAGHRLAFVREATSVHHWRDQFTTYLRQQYGFGYGRLDLVAKHPGRVTGDSVSPIAMMAHPIALALALLLLVAAGVTRSGGASALSLAIVATLCVERLVAGLRAWRRFGDRAALLFPVWHLARDLAWVAAIAVWTTRRLTFSRNEPGHSMSPRPGRNDRSGRPSGRPSSAGLKAGGSFSMPRRPTRTLGIIPAHNEGANLESVISEIRAHHPALDLVVVDDGSTDETRQVLKALGVPYLRLPERMGVGSAMRAGLGYAARLGYDAAIRLDGDGQHSPEEIDAMLAPLAGAQADVVLGSRYAAAFTHERPLVRVVQWTLARCVSLVTGTSVTDPTSGFCAIGPRALELLADHHPTGYPEPELRLFLSRNHLVAVEVPVQSRARLTGRSSLTPARLTTAAARVLLALLTVPFRRAVAGLDRD